MAKQSSKLLDHARASADETNKRLAEVRAARDTALLASDDTAPILKLDQEIAELTRIAIAKADRIKALEREAEREEVEQRAKRHAQLIERIEGLFNNWKENGEEIEKTVGVLLKLYRRQIELGGKIAVAWRWNTSDLGALRLHGLGIKELLAHEFYRTSFIGGIETGPHAVSLPGSICPNVLQWRLTPEKIQPFTDTLRELAAYGSRTIRGIKKEKPARITEKAS
jgi:hypothetical protein